MSIYKQIFLEAFTVTKQHKMLWIFGFFAILFSGSVEGDLYYAFLNNQKNTIYDLAQTSSTNLFSGGPGTTVTGLGSAGFLLFIFLCLILVLAFIVLLSVASQIIVIARTNEIIKAPKTLALKFSEIVVSTIDNLRANLVKATLVNILFKIFIFLVFLIIALPIFITGGLPNIVADFSYLILFVLLLPITIIASLYSKYVISAMVINQLSLKVAAQESWKIISKNWLLSMELSFILFIFNIISVFITLIIISGLSIPLWFLAVSVEQMISYQLYVVFMALSYLILFMVFLLCNSLVSTFSISAWTSLYLKLSKNNSAVPGFISNLSQKLPSTNKTSNL